MLAAGAYCAVASHDKPVIDHALSALKSYGMGPGAVKIKGKLLAPEMVRAPDMNFRCCWG